MIPYAEPGLLSEASLTSSSLCPEAAQPAEDVIDSCRPRGQLVEEVHSGKFKPVRCSDGGWGFRGGMGSGVAVLCVTSYEASWSTVEPSERQQQVRIQSHNTHEMSWGTYLSGKRPRILIMDGRWYCFALNLTVWKYYFPHFFARA